MSRFYEWMIGEADPLENVMDGAEVPDEPRGQWKHETKEGREQLLSREDVNAEVMRVRKSFGKVYSAVAIISCITLIGVLMYIVTGLPRFGEENPEVIEVIKRYIESGLQETGAVNIVSGMILDYRAFDTLGESHVLFTALMCVTILLRVDKKNMRTEYEDYYMIRQDKYFDLSKDSIIRFAGAVLIPTIALYGIYVLLNGQLSPGGGFSGGAVMGAGLVLFSAAYGFETVDRMFSQKAINIIAFISLSFYSFAKGYVFITGANGLDNHIPKGAPGAIFSGGLILPLDIAVGMVVACTMYSFYSLFRRGSVGGNAGTD